MSSVYSPNRSYPGSASQRNDLDSAEQVNILLVDDRPENLLALEGMLSSLGQNLVKATSGQEALKYLLDQDFAVILLDIMMPGIDGFEIATLIKERERSQHTPIIFITAIDQNEKDVFKGYSLGAVDYLFKPIVPETLRAKVATFVELFRKTKQVERQAERIEAVNRELGHQLREVKRLNRELEQANKMLETEIAERQAAQEALQEMNDQLELRVRERTSELKASNEELTTFTNIVSHDLRSPLVNLKGFTDELRSSIKTIPTSVNDFKRLDEEQIKTLELILQKDIPEAMDFIDAAVERMDNLTSALLRLARMGRRELNLERVDMDALVQTILNSLAHQVRQKAVSIEVGQLPWIWADRTAMEQIVGNLLTNAVLYLKPDCPGEIDVTGEARDFETVFQVRDNGRGIAEEDRQKVFEPFRRVGKSEAIGEGMGLAYVQLLVRRHGGRIWYTSELGVGSTFCFAIPNIGEG